MCYSTDLLVCINTAPRNNGCGAGPWISQILCVNFPWNLAHFRNSTVKSRIFPRELGWSLVSMLTCGKNLGWSERQSPGNLSTVNMLLWSYRHYTNALLLLLLLKSKNNNNENTVIKKWWLNCMTIIHEYQYTVQRFCVFRLISNI